MRDEFLIFGSPLIEEPEISEVAEVLRSGWLSTGPRVQQFQENFAAYKGVEEAVAVNSCTAALHLAGLCAGLRPGDEVIVPALTFCATVNAVVHAGATPVLADVDATMNISPQSLEEKITPQTRAILPVHFAGRPCDMDSICDIAGRHNLKVIEDCAHAIEAEYKGRKVGTIGDLGCFSFYVTKNLPTGEGGMILARSKADAERARVLGLHGLSKDAWKRFSDAGYRHYDVVDCGFKYNMMDIQAALGIHQLARLEQNWQRRREIWAQYNSSLCELPIELPPAEHDGCRHAYHLYTILVDETRCGISRDDLLDELTRRNVGVGVHYRGLAEHAYYQERFGWRPGQFPVATNIGRTTISIPLSAKLTDGDVDDVISALADVFRQVHR